MEYYSSLPKRQRRERDTAAADEVVSSLAVPATTATKEEDPTSSDEEEELLGQLVYNSSRTAQLRREQQQRQEKAEEEEVHKKKCTRKSFEQRIDDLRAYKEKHGHVNVKTSEDRSLYEFCSHMRRARHNPEKSARALTDDQVASLDALGFDWSVSERQAVKSFDQRIEDLQAYQEKHGHVNVKKGKEVEDKSLYSWLGEMRRARKHPEKSTTLINEERIASLDALGFDWAVKEHIVKSFEQRIEDLRAYKEKHGHINVRKSDDKSMYDFCMKMRQARKHPEKSDRILTDERIASLDTLGFKWTVRTREQVAKKSFVQRIEDLRAYKEKNGHINLKDREDKSLYRFCVDMRRARKNPKKYRMLINEERITSLDAMGFDWSVTVTERAAKKSLDNESKICGRIKV